MALLRVDAGKGICGDFRGHCDSFLKKDWRNPSRTTFHAPRHRDEFKVLYLKGVHGVPVPDGLHLVHRSVHEGLCRGEAGATKGHQVK